MQHFEKSAKLSAVAAEIPCLWGAQYSWGGKGSGNQFRPYHLHRCGQQACTYQAIWHCRHLLGYSIVQCPYYRFVHSSAGWPAILELRLSIRTLLASILIAQCEHLQQDWKLKGLFETLLDSEKLFGTSIDNTHRIILYRCARQSVEVQMVFLCCQPR